MSDISELQSMERSQNPGIGCTVETVASESQLHPKLSIPSLSPCHLHPSPLCTWAPASTCGEGKGREAPGCSPAFRRHRHKCWGRGSWVGERSSPSVSSSSDSSEWFLSVDICIKYSRDGELGALENKSREWNECKCQPESSEKQCIGVGGRS